MRILKVTGSYYPFLERGGPPVKVRALARGLARRGHRVAVLTADLGFAEGARAERSPWGRRIEEDGVEAIYLRSVFRYRALTLHVALRKFCRERIGEFDVAHLYGLYDLLGPGAASACRARGVPYVVEPMGMFRPIVRNIWLKRLYHMVFGRRMIQGARRVIATADQEAEELLAAGIPGEKIVVRRNGVELPPTLPASASFRKQWNIPADVKLVLFLGRLVTKKSPDLLLEAFARWQGKTGNDGGRLVFAGPEDEEEMRKRLETLRRKLGLREGCILWIGPQYDQAKWAAYRDADVFVLPSQNENFGNTAAESVAAGTPVIVTEQCGIAPLVADRAGLVVRHDAEAIAAALGRVLGDAALHARLAAGCAEVTRSLGWEEPVAAMETLYAELAITPKRSAPATVEGQ